MSKADAMDRSRVVSADPFESIESGKLRLMLEIGRLFNSSLELSQVLSRVMDKVIEVMKAERGCIMMLDEDDEPRPVTARGMDRTTIDREDFQVSRNLLRQVARTGQPLVSFNALEDQRFKAFESVAVHNLRSVLCVPMVFRERVVGLIYVDNRIREGVFERAHQHLLQAIAQLAAPALENARLYEMRRQIILVLANAIEAKDAYTRGHIERVCSYSLAIAEELELSPEDRRDLELCSFLHDAGKIGVPDAVLSKPGRLDDRERREMEKHPALGETLVLPIDIPRRVKLAIRHHQERFDGTGYPDGLAGEEIELFARIIAVADTWDAMTSDRPYRRALEREVAVEELRRAAGTQLDPQVVEAFLRVLERRAESSSRRGRIGPAPPGLEVAIPNA